MADGMKECPVCEGCGPTCVMTGLPFYGGYGTGQPEPDTCAKCHGDGEISLDIKDDE
jgi:hypothetical protein